jgi:glycosyltransferase involved in cell wall biosynthesis
MKVLYFTKYNRKGASSRLRSYQFFPLLEKEGITVTVQPFFDDTYLNNLYAKKINSKTMIFGFYLKRFFWLFTVFKYDKILIEKELFPYFFSWFEKLFWLLHINYIVDYDDAIFHNYDLNDSIMIRFFLKNKISNVMKFSGCVIVGNNYLADKAAKAAAKKIVLLPTVIDIAKYKITHKQANAKVIIGWIGSPTTFKYVQHLTAVFEILIGKYNIEIHIVGVNKDLGLGNAVQFISWTENSEVSAISNFDIGVMPLENTPWESGKCAYKLVQYMGCGIPVVASKVGMNVDVVNDGENGYLVQNKEEWVEKLSVLIENESLRNQFGLKGRLKVENEFSLKNNFKKLLTILNDKH